MFELFYKQRNKNEMHFIRPLHIRPQGRDVRLKNQNATG